MSATGRAFDGVLLDWCGTLVEYMTLEERLDYCLGRLGRASDGDVVAGYAAAVRQAESHPSAADALARCDLSAEEHAEAKLLVGGLAGLDEELSVELERSYADWDTYRTYPETVDVLRVLHRDGVQIAVVSDFHVDLRPWFVAHGVLDCVTGFAISCEVGAMKPDRRMFDAALGALTVPARRCLMVGDNGHTDAGAVDLAITTLLVPVVRIGRPRLLDRVVSLVGAP